MFFFLLLQAHQNSVRFPPCPQLFSATVVFSIEQWPPSDEPLAHLHCFGINLVTTIPLPIQQLGLSWSWVLDRASDSGRRMDFQSVWRDQLAGVQWIHVGLSSRFVEGWTKACAQSAPSYECTYAHYQMKSKRLLRTNLKSWPEAVCVKLWRNYDKRCRFGRWRKKPRSQPTQKCGFLQATGSQVSVPSRKFQHPTARKDISGLR